MTEPENDRTQVSLSAIILAGGQSSRMGRDKALLQVESIPLLQRVCQVAQKCANSVYIITPWPERYQIILDRIQVPYKNTTWLIREEPLPEETSPHGPLIGFAQGLAQIETDWVLLLACDLPCLEVEVLQTWVTQLSSVPQEIQVLLCKNSQGWWEPLCGFYRRQTLSTIEEFIQQGGRSFQRWLLQQTVQELSLPNPEMLFNCNTPEDLRQLERGEKQEGPEP